MLYEVITRRARAPGLQPHAAQQDGLVVLRHGAAALRGLPRARGQPDRRGERGLSRHHAELQRRAPHHGGDGRRLRPGLPRITSYNVCYTKLLRL